MRVRVARLVLTVLLGASLPAFAQGYKLPAERPSFPASDQKVAAPAGSLAVSSLLANPGFETNGGAGTNSFSAWTVVDQAGGTGSWFAQTGVASPLNAFVVPAPPEGTFQAMTDQSGPGSHVLYQDITLPNVATRLTFSLTINSAPPIAVPVPATLDALDALVPNQQFRVDVMDPAADVFDVGSGVLMNVFRMAEGDPQVSGPRLVYADLSAFAGRTVRIRFAEVDNQGFFNVGVDAVSIQESGNVPALGTPGLLAFGFALALAGAFALWRMASSR